MVDGDDHVVPFPTANSQCPGSRVFCGSTPSFPTHATPRSRTHRAFATCQGQFASYSSRDLLTKRDVKDVLVRERETLLCDPCLKLNSGDYPVDLKVVVSGKVNCSCSS